MAEALTGVPIGQVLSREMFVNSRVLTPWVMRKVTRDVSLSRDTFGLCAVVDLGMHGRKHLAREPGDPTTGIRMDH